MTEKKPISARPAIGRVETRAIPAREVNAALRERDDEIASLKEQVALLAASTRKRSRTTADEGADA